MHVYISIYIPIKFNYIYNLNDCSVHSSAYLFLNMACLSLSVFTDFLENIGKNGNYERNIY